MGETDRDDKLEKEADEIVNRLKYASKDDQLVALLSEYIREEIDKSVMDAMMRELEKMKEGE